MGFQAGQEIGDIVLVLGHAAKGVVDNVLSQQGVEHVAHAGGPVSYTHLTLPTNREV